MLPAGCGRDSETPPRPALVATKPSAGNPLVFMTWNVLADRVASAERMKSLFEIIKKDEPDVRARQEVTSWFLRELLEQP